MKQYGTDLEYRCPVAWRFEETASDGTKTYVDTIRTECQWSGAWTREPQMPPCVGKQQYKR